MLKGLEAKGLFSFKRRNNDAYMLIRRFRAREKLMLTRDGLNKEVFEKRHGVPTMCGGLCRSIWKLAVYLFIHGEQWVLSAVDHSDDLFSTETFLLFLLTRPHYQTAHVLMAQVSHDPELIFLEEAL